MGTRTTTKFDIQSSELASAFGYRAADVKNAFTDRRNDLYEVWNAIIGHPEEVAKSDQKGKIMAGSLGAVGIISSIFLGVVGAPVLLAGAGVAAGAALAIFGASGSRSEHQSVRDEFKFAVEDAREDAKDKTMTKAPGLKRGSHPSASV